MKHIIFSVVLTLGMISIASAASYVFVQDEDVFAKIRVDGLSAEVYRMVDTEHSNVCYLAVYPDRQGFKADPDLQCVASSTPR